MKRFFALFLVAALFCALLGGCSLKKTRVNFMGGIGREDVQLPGKLPNDSEFVPATTDFAPERPVGTTEAQTVVCEEIYLDAMKIVFSETGESRMLYATTRPADTTQEIYYTSSDKSVATVNENGKVTAVAAGRAWVVVTCGDVSAACEVECAFEEEIINQPKNEVPYLLTISTNHHNIFSMPSYDSSVVRGIEIGVFTIVEEQYDNLGNLWGKLKSGLGWVCVTDIQAEN